MNEIIEDSVLAYLQKKLRDLMNERADIVATGGCENWDAYKHMTGVIEGLAFAEREVLDLADRLKRAE